MYLIYYMLMNEFITDFVEYW